MDYATLSGSVPIPAGQVSATINVLPIWDQLVEGTETVQVTLAAGSYAIGSQSNGMVTILDAPMQRVWSGTGNWNDSTLWAGGIVPVAGDGVLVTNGAMVLSNSTPQLAYFTITNASLTFSNWSTALQASNVTICSNGKLYHYANSDTNGGDGWSRDNRIYVICTNLTVDTNGQINADYKGFGGSTVGMTNGYGPGGGGGGPTVRGGGGGYGGIGGNRSGYLALGGPVYGSTNAPDWPGSGGGVDLTSTAGGAGGGLITIVASGVLTHNGVITANGADVAGESGAGSGGGVSIACGTLSGFGSLSANGGKSTGWGGTGGGGRIAVDYQTVSNWSGFMQANCGSSVNSVSQQIGTIYFPRSLLPSIAGNAWYGRISGASSLTIPSFDLNGSLLAFEQDGVQVTVTSNLTLRGAATLKVSTLGTNVPAVYVGGNMVISNGSFYVTAPATNTVTDYGALVSVTGDLYVGTNSVVYPISNPTNGGSVLFRAANVTVATNGKFMADNAGFAGGYTGRVKGYGPGGSTNGSNSGGAGYGGKGGAGTGTPGGMTYGDPVAPILPGSGAGTANGSQHPCGGGLVRIDATGGKITLNGALSANGQGITADRDGGGSGGGIFLKCTTLEGGGSMNANGGAGGFYGGGGGGAGRIAVWYLYSNYTGIAVSTGGVKGSNAGAPATNGSDSVAVWNRLPAPPLITNNAATSISFFSASMNATVVSTGTAPTYVSVFWGPSDGGTNKSGWPHTNDFPIPAAEGSVVSTNIAGLDSGAFYVYRYYASNSAGEAWAPLPSSFTTIAGVPVISNAASGATGVTLTSATLNGNLVSIGTAATSLKVFWGPTDGGTNGAAWANTNVFPGTQSAGIWSTNVSLGTPNIYYYYTFYATNAGGEVWATPSSAFIAANVTLAATDPSAVENGPNNTGTFTVTRPATLTNLPLTVNYSVSGTAANGVDYQPLSGSIVIPASASSNTITITPIMDAVFDSPDKWVKLTLAPGNYSIGTPSNDTVTIQDVAPSATNTFTGTGVWQSVSNWSDGIAPLAGQSAVINGSATLSNATVNLASLIVATNKLLTFSTTNAIVYATDVTVAGTITHNVNTATNSPWIVDNSIHIICTNLTVVPGGSIDVTGKGYAGRAAAPAGAGNGYGFGGGTSLSARGGGGAYGGLGGNGQGNAFASGVTYGLAAAPVYPGSSGCAGQSGSGAGGGLIRIEASGTVTVNGTMKATGGTGLEDSGGGGSGGALYITCAALAGSGAISANGGNSSSYGGPGGGGRIAVAFDPVAQSNQNQIAAPTVSFGANPGVIGASSSFAAWPGTLYLPNNSFLSPAILQSVELAGFTNFAPASATLTGKWWVTTSGFVLSVSNGLTIGAAGRLDLSNGVLTVGGDLIMTNSATLITQSGIATTSALVNVAGLMYVGSNCTVYPYCYPTNGAAPLFTVRDLTVATNGKFNADGKGYATGLGIGHGTYGSGGGYGGQGGQELYSVNRYLGGITYGSSNAPVDPGSGGGRVVNDANGGGLVHVEASGTVQLDGIITANGQSDTGGDRSGGGSGGGIYIRCLHFAGNGSLSANGANQLTWSGGGGGGGRIAVWMLKPFHTVAATATGGIGKDNTGQTNTVVNGQNGTIVFGTLANPGVVFTFR